MNNLDAARNKILDILHFNNILEGKDIDDFVNVLEQMITSIVDNQIASHERCYHND